METDARGQLGGVETTDNVRRRLAGESGSFRCSTCGKSNEEIIQESEARCAEQGGASNDPVEIPSELKMGYRDEIEGKKTEGATPQGQPLTNAVPSAAEDAETAELAEGFVQTAPDMPVPAAPATAAPNPAAAPGQGPPQPTAANENAAMARPAHAALVAPRRHSDDGVPLWIDRAIVVLVVLLAALLLKIMFDF
jgi:ubiquitin-conjugating enzyme E2 J1